MCFQHVKSLWAGRRLNIPLFQISCIWYFETSLNWTIEVEYSWNFHINHFAFWIDTNGVLGVGQSRRVTRNKNPLEFDNYLGTSIYYVTKKAWTPHSKMAIRLRPQYLNELEGRCFRQYYSVYQGHLAAKDSEFWRDGCSAIYRIIPQVDSTVKH